MKFPRNLGDIATAYVEHPSRAAIIDLREPANPQTFAYEDLARSSGGVATYLTACGFAPGARIGILSLNRFEYLAAYFGIMRAGFVAVPLNIRLSEDTIAYMFEDAHLELAFIEAPFRSVVPDSCGIVDFDDVGPTGFSSLVRPVDFATPSLPEGAEAEMLYTSGSSGIPKGVPLSHEGQLWALEALAFEQQDSAQTQIIAQPLFHMNGIVTSALALLAGDTIVLQPRFNAGPYVDAIERYDVSSVNAVPTMWVRALKETEAHPGRLSSVRSLSLGSAPTTDELLTHTRARLPDCTIHLSYGTTEAGPAIFGPHPEDISPPGLALGYPLDGVELRLVDGPSSDEGVLVVRTPAMMSGYHNLSERTAAVLDDGWYNTGDMMSRDGDGFYYFAGRSDDMFVCSGENIYPAEVERLIERHPGVFQVAVVPLPDSERGHVPVAFVVPVSGQTLDTAGIKDFALAHGAAYLHPRRVAIRRELPLASTNKTDRTALLRLATDLEANAGWST